MKLFPRGIKGHPRRSALAFSCLSACGLFLVSWHHGTKAAESINLDGRPLIFNEEFNDISVSADGHGAVWGAHTPWHGDFGQARFVDPSSGFPFVAKNGMLDIVMKRNPEGAWESGLLASSPSSGRGFSAPYGYFEMRARLPAGDGVWPGFWLDELVPPGSKNNSLEVDIIEQYGRFPAAYNSTVTEWNRVDPAKTHSELHINRVPQGTMSAGFHTYGADVTPTEIIFYFDRHEVWRTHAAPRRHGNLIILVDLALGGGWPIDQTPDPSIMVVDYIRVYQEKNVTPEEKRTHP